MEITPLRLPGTYLIKPSPIGDKRGYFMEYYRRDLFEEHGLVTDWAQENQSLSAHKGVVRGLHFQFPPHAETKLVRTVQGKAWDVFVDLRRDSDTYGQWDAVELSEDNQYMVYIPKGFAHGFCTLMENTLLQYKVDAFYTPTQGGLMWNDPTLNIAWPCTDPILSERDQNLPKFADFDTPF